LDEIFTERLKLELISKLYIDNIFELYSSPDVCQFYDIEPFLRIEQAEEHVKRWLDFYRKEKQIRFAILKGNQFIGTCGLYMINDRHQRACLGYDLNPSYWGNGYANEAVNAMLLKCQKKYKLHRIQAELLEGNNSSIKLLEKLGFQKEGIFKQYEKWGRKGFVDLIIYSKIYGIEE
jgi:[ribosomal protein S5]-alanine N-acetyltransferase